MPEREPRMGTESEVDLGQATEFYLDYCAGYGGKESQVDRIKMMAQIQKDLESGRIQREEVTVDEVFEGLVPYCERRLREAQKDLERKKEEAENDSDSDNVENYSLVCTHAKRRLEKIQDNNRETAIEILAEDITANLRNMHNDQENGDLENFEREKKDAIDRMTAIDALRK